MTREEAEALVQRANVHIGKKWIKGNVEYEFKNTGIMENFKERVEGEPEPPDNFKISNVMLVAEDGRRLHKSLQEIIDHFE